MRTYSIPAHGTEARYKGTRSGSRPPCRCDLCTRGNRLAGVRRKRAHAAGIDVLVGADTLVPHIRKLVASKMSQTLIARRAGVSQTTISYLLNGKIQSCQHDKAVGILAVQPGEFDEKAERPALGATRRVRALYATGHGRDGISAVCGVAPCTIGQIANCRYGLIDGRTDAAIRLAYRLLADTRGTSWKARQRAQSMGWAPVGAWDDEALDDPQGKPDFGNSDLGFRERAELRREEIIHFAWHGDTPEQILARLGNEVSISTVRQIVQDWRTGQKRDRRQVAADVQAAVEEREAERHEAAA